MALREFIPTLLLWCAIPAVGSPCGDAFTPQTKTPEPAHPSLAEARELIASQKTPLESRLMYSSPQHGDSYAVTGVPANARLVDYLPTDVFRYYIVNSAHFDEISASHRLRAGRLPYIIVHPGIRREYYYSLEGIFITKPEFKAAEVGLPNDPTIQFVDFTLPAGLGLIQLEPGIFLVPGRPYATPWIQEAFDRYRANPAGGIPLGLEEAFKNLERSQSKAEATFEFVPIKTSGPAPATDGPATANSTR